MGRNLAMFFLVSDICFVFISFKKKKPIGILLMLAEIHDGFICKEKIVEQKRTLHDLLYS